MNGIPAVKIIFWERFWHKPPHPHGVVKESPTREDAVIENQEKETDHVEGDHGQYQIKPGNDLDPVNLVIGRCKEADVEEEQILKSMNCSRQQVLPKWCLVSFAIRKWCK